MYNALVGKATSEGSKMYDQFDVDFFQGAYDRAAADAAAGDAAAAREAAQLLELLTEAMAAVAAA